MPPAGLRENVLIYSASVESALERGGIKFIERDSDWRSRGQRPLDRFAPHRIMTRPGHATLQ